MFKQLRLTRLIVFLIFFGSITQTHVLVFDVGDVLFGVPTSNKLRMARNELGLWDLIWHRLYERRDIKHVVFDFFKKEFGIQIPENGCLPATHGANEILPQVMCNWLANYDLQAQTTLSEQECIDQACAKVDASTHLNSPLERKLAKRLIKAMFDPATLAAYTSPIPEAAQLLAECAAQKDAKGNPKHTFFILSNYSTECFKALANKPESDQIFKYFDLEKHAIVSGDCHTIKPYTSIYNHLKARLVAFDSQFEDENYLAHNCVFVDDQISNILEGRRCGIKQSLWLSHGDYAKLRQEFVDLGILDS